MPSQEALGISREALSTFCQKWRIKELSLFGSVARGDSRPNSDIDFLVTFDEGAEWGLLEHASMQGELAEIFGKPVDLVSRRAVEQSPNAIRREEILTSAEVLYAA